MFHKEKLDMRIKYTREWTFEALSRLLEHKEYHDIKISEIIEKAGVSRATFYRNFLNKDDIVRLKVQMFFQEFHSDMLDFYKKSRNMDEQYLIQSLFKKIDEEEQVIDTVIKTNLDYTMIDGILDIIYYAKDRFYELIKTNKTTEEYIMDIVASSTWTLLSRWHKTGRKETPSELAEIYMSAFRSVYIAIYEDQSKL